MAWKTKKQKDAEKEAQALRDGIARALGLEGDLLAVFTKATDAERLEILNEQINQLRITAGHYEDAALLNARRPRERSYDPAMDEYDVS